MLQALGQEFCLGRFICEKRLIYLHSLRFSVSVAYPLRLVFFYVKVSFYYIY